MNIYGHQSAPLGQVNFTSRQVDFQFACPDGRVEKWGKYQKCQNIFPDVINFKVLICGKSKLGKFIQGGHIPPKIKFPVFSLIPAHPVDATLLQSPGPGMTNKPKYKEIQNSMFFP